MSANKRIWKNIKTCWGKRKSSQIEPTNKVIDGAWVHKSQTQYMRAYWPEFLSEPMYFLKFSSLPENIDRDFLTPHPSFNKYGWAWIGPEEDKDNKPKPWEENSNIVTVMQWGEEVKINIV